MEIARILRLISVTFIIYFNCLSTQAQQMAQKFIQETDYLLSLPDGYDQDTTKRWPLIIFLHGSGESGTDLQKVKVHGLPKLIEQGKKFPFIVVSPQAQLPFGWEPENLYKLLLYIKETNRVDDKRIYLTGLSMGGFGTWAFAMKHPEEFAAIAPVCGGGDTTEAWKLRYVPIWCFHGAKDDVVLPAQSEHMVAAARRYNSSVKFTLYPNANHNSWDTTYNNDSLYQWMLSHTKFTYKEVPVDATQLKQYTGRYAGAGKDTVTILIDNGGLVAKPGKELISLKAAGNNVFFVQPDLYFDVHFTKKKDIVNGFLFMGNERVFFKKL
ncbi:prolyl oligopeptidase family serine peptidase [Chitinophagaceae bacterium LB-8]|uniref:Prolyl oligopeptidase family serine peptidase n=1 Tax=Paraflavisolibacter caeni TaxID=2982496 RepID=A0A9X2XRQ5_9BACT|nr:prolyl oligopeptidase family serine peptidase [Paraflavisolibacter caeni]MCU7547534.1 prolyl oligopeptidase family serine peptidase [Paraflavisolibacter caeni]